MCRLVAYLGQDILLEDVLVKPTDSLVKQSLHAQESSVLTNGDGFGIGWYVPQISRGPAIFLSIFPAWNDQNLLHLTAKIKSSNFFGHVRAASIGGVNNYNCHPFNYKQWMFMHNGTIGDFLAIKRQIRNLLDDDIYNWIKGETDSEHFFALFLQLAKGKNLSNLVAVAAILVDTIAKIKQLLAQLGKHQTSFYNICLTDGRRIVASRYCTNKNSAPETMYYLAGRYFWSEKDYLQEIELPAQKCVMIASEKLTDFSSQQWYPVAANHLLLVDRDLSIQMQEISLD